MKQAIMNNTAYNKNSSNAKSGFGLSSNMLNGISNSNNNSKKFVSDRFNLFTNNKDNNKHNKVNTKIDTIKVCIRVRPLLDHEDVEFWKPDQTSSILTTAE